MPVRRSLREIVIARDSWRTHHTWFREEELSVKP
jgi:hypothetical protein